jgi:pSer/pThr/pTyr-binding forkhead associated (FHA) protein
MDKCPYCGAETRPGDNFCLNCGNRLPAVVAPQATPGVGDPTLAADNEWMAATARADSSPGASISHDAPTERAEPPTVPGIENPGRLTLRTDTGEVLQDYVLEKFRVSIGRAPSSDILLSKDKLTSRNHATILYESGEYVLVDERSANGTFVNGQQLEEKTSYKLRDGDHVGIGEYELIFHANTANGVDVESMPTVMVNSGGTQTYATHEDPQLTAANGDEWGTRPWEGDINSIGQSHGAESPVPTPAFAATIVEELQQSSVPPKIVETPVPVVSAALSAATPVIAPVYASTPAANPVYTSAPTTSAVQIQAEASGVTFGRLTSLPQPQLPDVAPLMAALATLDGQVSSFQEQLNATQEAMRNHDAEIAQTTNQLRSGVRRVSERMDNTIAEVARSREQLAWAELLQLMEDVMNNPRDIEYVTKLARKARELNKVFQIHQNVLNTLAECTSLLRSLISE